MSHTGLADRLRTKFELKEYGQGGRRWDLNELDGLFPYELDLYILMTQARIQERREAANVGSGQQIMTE